MKTTKRSLTQKQKEMMKRHQKHHTKKHMDYMKDQMKKGVSFATAHNKALKTIGK